MSRSSFHFLSSERDRGQQDEGTGGEGEAGTLQTHANDVYSLLPFSLSSQCSFLLALESLPLAPVLGR